MTDLTQGVLIFAFATGAIAVVLSVGTGALVGLAFRRG